MDFYLYMGLEVGGCSLFADPSGYVGRRTHQPWEDEGHVTGVTYHSLRRGWSRWLELQVQ